MVGPVRSGRDCWGRRWGAPRRTLAGRGRPKPPNRPGERSSQGNRDYGLAHRPGDRTNRGEEAAEPTSRPVDRSNRSNEATELPAQPDRTGDGATMTTG